MPEVLVRFRAAVDGAGNLGGPYRKPGRQDLWWWTASSRPDVEHVYSALAPWLCSIKVNQLQIALGLSPHPPARSLGEELAWAAGFFDAEGSVSLLKHGSHTGYFVGEAAVTQLGDATGSEELSRFRAAVSLGKIFGPFTDRGGARSAYRWKVFPLTEICAVIDALRPWLGTVKRGQADRVLDVLVGQPTLPRGNPAWGSYKTHCVNGHEYATARIRRFGARQGGAAPRESSRCLVCARDAARARRELERELESAATQTAETPHPGRDRATC